MHHSSSKINEAETKGLVIHRAKLYNGVFGGLLSSSEERIIELAEIKPGHNVLDLGCGPGRITLKAKAKAGQNGKVFGIDASREMIELAKSRASKEGIDVNFLEGLAQELPFPDETFDVVLNRLVIHHLPKELLHKCFAEMQRTLKPGGLCLVVDFDIHSLPVFGTLLKALVHHRMPQTDVRNFVPLGQEAGFTDVEAGPTGKLLLAYVKGRKKAG